MLWFANASDGPTWYVGKKEEFGQARGWLQVKSDAASPAEIRGTWGIWSAAEKVRQCASLGCATARRVPRMLSARPRGC